MIAYHETDCAEVAVDYETRGKFYRGFWIPGKTFRLWGQPVSEAAPAQTKRDLIRVLAALPDNLTKKTLTQKPDEHDK